MNKFIILKKSTILKNFLININELILFKHSIFSLPFIFIAMIVAAKGWFGWKLFFLGIVSAISARNFAMAFNRYLDRDIDKLNPRTINRPSVDGRLSSKTIFIFIILNSLIFIGTAYFVNQTAFIASMPILLVLGGYSYFKRFSYFAHLILGLALGLAPIAGVIAVEENIPLWSIYLAIGVTFWVAGFDLLYSLQDIDFDKKNGLHSIPVKFGWKNSLRISFILHILTIIFWSLFVIEAKLGFFGYLAIIASAIMLSYEHILVNRNFKKIDRAFFTVNGYLGILFLLLIIFDKIGI